MDDGNYHDDPKNGNTGGFEDGDGGTDGPGNLALRPVFLGNLSNSFTSDDVIAVFERPINPPNTNYSPIAVERVDLKRGYCFVFLKDALSHEAKESVERFVNDINGMEVPNLSSSLRAEFARGDGRVKRKEDDRRKRIQPSETLFVVNFHEQTTKREDLRMLFEPYGELVRIEMKRNFAFVQFQNIESAIAARDAVNGGKLDQSVLTVEFVAQDRGGGADRRGGGSRGDRRAGGDRRRDSRDRPDDYYRRRSPPRDRYYDDKDYRRRSPPPRYRGHSRSRSRSPPRYDRRRSPRGRDYYDDRGWDRGADRGRGERGERFYRGSDRP